MTEQKNTTDKPKHARTWYNRVAGHFLMKLYENSENGTLSVAPVEIVDDFKVEGLKLNLSDKSLAIHLNYLSGKHGYIDMYVSDQKVEKVTEDQINDVDVSFTSQGVGVAHFLKDMKYQSAFPIRRRKTTHQKDKKELQ